MGQNESLNSVISLINMPMSWKAEAKRSTWDILNLEKAQIATNVPGTLHKGKLMAHKLTIVTDLSW